MKKTLLITLILFFTATTLLAQHPGALLPGHPGAPVQNYFQPVKIHGPEGTKIALAVDGKFVDRQEAPHAVGLLLSADYRLRITDIPQHPGKEIFPSIKIIGRTFPPRGLELEFPIQIEITREDLDLALDGKFVTRVIYLEDPQNAMPVPAKPEENISVDVPGGADPLNVAATLGQPIAIVRLGGRVPDLNYVDPAFFHGCPGWIAFDKTPQGMLMTRYQNTPQRPVYVGTQPQAPIY